MSNVVSETKMFRLYESVSANTHKLCGLQTANERTSTALEIMYVKPSPLVSGVVVTPPPIPRQVILTGSLAFDILDRVFGEWTVVDTTWMQAVADALLKDSPALWLLINLVRC